MNERVRRIERRLSLPLLLAALLTIPALLIEQSSAGATLDGIARGLDWIVRLAFVAPASLMLRVVDDRLRWLRDHPWRWRSSASRRRSCPPRCKWRACSVSCGSFPSPGSGC